MLRNNNVVAAPAAQSLEGDVAAPGNMQAPQNVVQPGQNVVQPVQAPAAQTVDAAQISQGVSDAMESYRSSNNFVDANSQGVSFGSRGVRVNGQYGDIVSVDGVNEDGSLQMTVNMDGQEQQVSSSQVQGFGTERVGVVMAYAAQNGMSPEAINQAISGNTGGVGTQQFMEHVATAYEQGRSGQQFEATGNEALDSTLQGIYAEGQQNRSADVSESATQADANAAEVAGVQDEVTEGNRERGRSRLEQARANAAEAQARMEQAAQDMAAGNATQEDVDAAADELTQARLEERRAEVEAQRNEVTEGNRQRARERGAENSSQGETQTEEAQDRGGVVDNNNGRAPVNVSTGLRSAMDLAMRLEGSDAATFARQLQADIDKGRKVSARKAGKLMRLLQEHNVNGVSEAARGINQNAL